MIHKMAQNYLEEVIAVYRPQRSLRSENSVTLVKAKNRTSKQFRHDSSYSVEFFA
jgi:hypothetical protein